MSKSKMPEIQPAPSYAPPDQYYGLGQGQIANQTSGIFNNFSGLSPLMQETINTNPDITRLTLEGLQAQLAPSYRTGLQNITNTLEANGQLTGSTTASALGNYESDYMAQLTVAGANAGIQDINRALQNRIGLYGTALNASNSMVGNSLNQSGQQNQFALQNYENQVASALMSQPQNGGWMGAITGAVGGAMSGASMGSKAGPYGALAGGVIGAGLGGYSGYQGSSGTGGQFLQAGASMLGNRNSTPLQTVGGGESIYNPIYQPKGGGLSGNGSYFANQYYGF